MSVDLMVFLKREKLPTRDRWQQAIDAEGFELTLDEVNTATHTGFWPVKLNGKECGFEYFFGKAEFVAQEEVRPPPGGGWWGRLFGRAASSARDEPNQPDEFQSVRGDRNYSVTLTVHASRDDLQAASLASAVLAKVADGVFFDPQSGEFAIGAVAFQLLEDQELSERDRKMGVATEKWATATERRCPECGAPCPEYRPTCFVCNYKIGRA